MRLVAPSFLDSFINLLQRFSDRIIYITVSKRGSLQRTGVYLLTLTRAEATQGGGLSIEIALDLEGVVTSLVTR